MSNETCILSPKDLAILKTMRGRRVGRDDPYARILRKKIESAVVMSYDDVPASVATLNSRVSFSVDGRAPDMRVISPAWMTAPVGIVLPITTARGLALLGLPEGQDFIMTTLAGGEERIVLHEVLYQPEAARWA